MQGREDELGRLYEILDNEGFGKEVEDKYVESVRRRLSRESIPSHKMVSKPITKFLPKPKVRIFGGIEKKSEKEEETEMKEERTEEVEDLFEVEKLSKEELKEILEVKEFPIESKIKEEKTVPKERFVEIVSKVKGIGRKKAEALYECGFKSFDKILKSDAKEIAERVKGLSQETAERLKREVSEILPKIEEEFDQLYLLKEGKEEGKRVEKEISKVETEFTEELPEWITIDKTPIDEEPIEWKKIEKEEPYRYEDYTLYKVEKRGKVKYVFSKRPVKGGEPCKIPKGYIVRVNKKGRPSLEKVK